MRGLEVSHRDEDGKPQDIRDILLQVLTDSETDKDAAAALNIDNTTLSTWISKLDIVSRAAAIRGERNEYS